MCIIDKNCQVSLAISYVINHCTATDNLIKTQNGVFDHKRTICNSFSILAIYGFPVTTSLLRRPRQTMNDDDRLIPCSDETTGLYFPEILSEIDFHSAGPIWKR